MAYQHLGGGIYRVTGFSRSAVTGKYRAPAEPSRVISEVPDGDLTHMVCRAPDGLLPPQDRRVSYPAGRTYLVTYVDDQDSFVGSEYITGNTIAR